MKLRGSKSHTEMFSMKLGAESELVACTLVVLAFCRLRQEACHEFEASVNNIVRLGHTQGEVVLFLPDSEERGPHYG